MTDNAQSAPPRPLTPLWKLLPLEFAILNLVAMVSAVLAFYVHWIAALVAAIVLGIGVFIAGGKYRQKTFFLTGGLAMLAGLFALLGLGEAARIKAGVVVRGIAVNQALQHPKAVSFYFKEGQVLTRFTTHLRIITGTTTKNESINDYWVAPVVGQGWRPHMPVSVWAVCDFYDCQKQWRQPHRAGVREPEISGGFRKAIAKATKEHALRSVAKPMLLRWIADPRAEAEAYARAFWVALAVCNLIWLGFMIWWRRADLRKAQEPAEPALTPPPIE